MPYIPYSTSKGTTTVTPSEAALGNLGIPMPIERPNNILTVIDAHSVANYNQSLAESTVDAIASIPKFVGASLVSGVSQLYNIAPTIGNAFGGDFEYADTSEWMQKLDDDLSEYYTRHKDSADVMGFILSSMVPGSAGVKILNAGQKVLTSAVKTGNAGWLTTKATGLLVPKQQVYLKQAISQITNANTGFRIGQANILKALGSGVHASVLEGVFFETAIATTMYNSPVLEDQDVGDLVSNIMTGGLLFGAIGGTVQAAKSVFAIKNSIKSAASTARPWEEFQPAPKGMAPGDSILHYNEEIAKTPPIPDVHPLKERIINSRAKRIEGLQKKMHEEFIKLADNDTMLGQQLYNEAIINGNAKVLDTYIGSLGVSRLSTMPRKYKEVIKILEDLKNTPAKAAKKYGIEAVEEAVTTKLSWTKQWGDDAGEVTTVAPEVTSLADLLKPGKYVEITKESVKAGKQSWKFRSPSEKAIDRWDITHADVLEAQARYVWIRKIGLGDAIGVYENDLPLLEAAYRNFFPGRKFFLEDGSIRYFQTQDDLLNFIQVTKDKLSNRFQHGTVNGKYYSDPQAMVAKLKQLTGIKFGTEVLAKHVKAYQETLSPGVTKIVINSNLITGRSVGEWLNTLKHKEGHQVFNTLMEFGTVPVSMHKTVLGEMEKVSRVQRPELWKTAAKENNYSYVRHPHELAVDTFAYFSKFPDRAQSLAPNFYSFFSTNLRPLSQEVVAKYISDARRLSQKEIAALLNVRNSYLSGELSANKTRDLFALDSYAEEYTTRLKNAGLYPKDKAPVEIWNYPQHQVMATSTKEVTVDGNVLKGIAIIEQKKREYQAALDRAFASVLPEFAESFPEITPDIMGTLNSLGSERGFLTSANANYGSLASMFQYIGSIASKAKQGALQQTDDLFQPALSKMLDDPAAAIEFATLNAKLRAIPHNYILQNGKLVLQGIAKYEKVIADGLETVKPIIPEGIPESIAIKNSLTRELIEKHINQNGQNLKKITALRAVQGIQMRADPTVFYPIPVNQKDFRYFATVHNENLVGYGQTRTIYAHTENELNRMIDAIKSEPGLIVRTKGEQEEWYKLIDKFSFEKTIHDTEFDNLLKRKGVSTPYYVPTDPKKITQEFLAWHKDRTNGLVLEAVSSKYEIPFSQIEAMSKQYTNVATSKVGSSSLLKKADATVKNPYMDLIKVALDLKNYSDYPFWVKANRLLDEKVTQMFSSIEEVTRTSKTDEELLQINKLLKESGYTGAAYTHDMEILANHTAPRGALTSFIQKSNALLATTMLRLDHLNALNNGLGSYILTSTELKAVINSIKLGDEKAVGKLTELAYIKIPGTDKLALSPAKLFAAAIKDFSRDSKQMQWFKEHNFVTSITDQYKWTLDQLTLEGKEAVSSLNSKITKVRESLVKAANKGEEWTGNKLTEEFNRFVSAHIMKQLTDVAVNAGKMTQKEALAYINTFVNRTQGNYLASQRPMLFQGPIGQAIGLFQTYQFNIIQQLLRHVGEGRAKDWSTLLGLQGTIYGLNGLPGFNFINTHIIGTATGNKEHRDAYTTVYGGVNKDAADWLMYGISSNFLMHPDAKINMYTRGDINPRHVTIIPTTPADVPIYGAYSKFFGNLFDAAGNLAAGGNISTTLIRAIEHNGISRPLAGLAQSIEAISSPEGKAFSTTKRGDIIGSNDLISFMTLARMAGGKPLTEAITTDAAFRFRHYQMEDQARRSKLGEAIKSTLIAGNRPTVEQMNDFAEKYVSAGGDMKNFARWILHLYTKANTSQANAIKDSLTNKFSQEMQMLMGGEGLEDFTSSQ